MTLSPQHKNSIHILNMRLFPLQLKCMYLIRSIISRDTLLNCQEKIPNRVPKLNYSLKGIILSLLFATSPLSPLSCPLSSGNHWSPLSLQINLHFCTTSLYKLNNTIWIHFLYYFVLLLYLASFIQDTHFEFNYVVACINSLFILLLSNILLFEYIIGLAKSSLGFSTGCLYKGLFIQQFLVIWVVSDFGSYKESC